MLPLTEYDKEQYASTGVEPFGTISDVSSHVKTRGEEVRHHFNKEGSIPKDDFGNSTFANISGCIVTNDKEREEECTGGE
jgi:hypothetical protein